MEKTREHWVDIYKRIAIFLVVMDHVVTSYRNSNLLTDAGGVNFICDYIYFLHVAVFVISGFLLEKISVNQVKNADYEEVDIIWNTLSVFSVGIWL